jgi:hypothetical protein
LAACVSKAKSVAWGSNTGAGGTGGAWGAAWGVMTVAAAERGSDVTFTSLSTKTNRSYFSCLSQRLKDRRTRKKHGGITGILSEYMPQL